MIARLFLLAVVSFLVACGGASPSPATPVEEPSNGLVITESAAVPWRTYTDGPSGFTVSLPAEPKLTHGTFGVAGGQVRSLVVSDGDPRTPDYQVDRFQYGPGEALGDAEAFADALIRGWKRGARMEERERHGRATIEITGEAHEGKVAVCATAGGRYLYVLTVTSSETIDVDLAERFFDSLRIEMPWRIEVFPADALTVSIPGPALLLPVTPPDGAELHVYYLKWDGEIWISVTLFTLTEERVRTASLDEILDDGARGVAQGDGVTIDKLITYEHHGLRGREIVHTAQDGQAFRSRLFIAGRRGYHVSVGGMGREILTQEIATRVLDSIRIGAAP